MNEQGKIWRAIDNPNRESKLPVEMQTYFG